jgi:capsular exopolysaccharide synthesis family protein
MSATIEATKSKIVETAMPAAAPVRRRTSALLMVDPFSIQAEALRGLRTRVVAQHLNEGRRAIAICTPHEGSGCTFTATNLAIAVAQIGIKTVLVDANLRGGDVGGVFDIPADRIGLSDYLADESLRYGDIVEGEVLPDLSIISAGRPKDNAQELLSSARFSALVSQMLREFELAIFDTTPANTCTDAQCVSTVVGYSLIVARKHQTYVNDVKTLANLLRADKSMIVGTVLNDF